MVFKAPLKSFKFKQGTIHAKILSITMVLIEQKHTLV